jgi:hypothetical protein
MYKALRLSPMVPSYSIDQTAAFFADVLNFSFYMNGDTYIIMHKDDLASCVQAILAKWNFI